ncbi:MAG: adenylate/guanylate cyclase domain-containing protein, partial [Cyclobacteriaceae bacterium]|nr:adenylate/guanylate cyclase domain-containing protein [Cyclobacteriaceae bacterium]
MTNQIRQLAAIMFTDIVGYTALMGRDEEKGLALLRKNREIHKPLIEKHNGKWIKEMGDGMLAQFDSAYN